MALVINDRVKETSTTTGTGAWHLVVLQLVLKLLIVVLELNNTTYYVSLIPGTISLKLDLEL